MADYRGMFKSQDTGSKYLEGDQLKLLVSGFIRMITWKIDAIFPQVIIKLCQIFFNPGFYHRFNAHDLEEFWKSRRGDPVHCETFERNNLLFQCSIYSSNNSVAFYLGLVSDLPQLNIKSVKLYFNLYNEELNIDKKYVDTFDHGCVALKWEENTMHKSRCLTKATLSFGCYVRVLHTKCSDQQIQNSYQQRWGWASSNRQMAIAKKDYICKIEMNKYAKYKWTINEYLLESFRLYELGVQYFDSRTFGGNDCWCLRCRPFGNYECVDLSLKLLCVPQFIKSVKVEWVLRTNYNNNIPMTLTSKFSHVYKCGEKEVFWDREIVNFKFQKLSVLNLLTFSIELKILEVINYNNQLVQPNDWPAYGIICDELQE